MGKEEIKVGIDVGTTKIAAAIARINEDYKPTIMGVGTRQASVDPQGQHQA